MPVRFAPETASGPVRASSSSATGCIGIRIDTAPRSSPRSQASEGACSITRVSGPGQNASTSARTSGWTISVSPSRPDQEPTMTGIGRSRPRPLLAASASTAAGWNASAASP